MATEDSSTTTDLADEGALYASLVENSFDAIVSKNLDGIIRSWNPAAEKIFGWTAAEVVGKSIRLLIPDDRHHEEDHIIARIRAGETILKFETVRRHKSGGTVPVAITVSPLRDREGKIVGASKIAHDISETVRIRAKVQESELMFRTLANSISQFAWIADADGNIFWYNDRWYAYTGTTLEEMRGWGWIKVHHPDHVERVKTRIQHSWDTGEEWEDTFPLKGKNGEYHWFLSRARPVLGPDGRVVRWFGTNTDITCEREAEEQIRLLMAEVNHRAKNMIAVVQALVYRTAEHEYGEGLSRRLQALARNQDMLTRRNWTGVPIGELITSQLAVVADLVGTRIKLSGDLDFTLAPSASEAIGLAIHELATNSTKYGALSDSTGYVSIVCSIARSGETSSLIIEWIEQGGPRVEKPTHSGFGTVMIERNPKVALNATVELLYEPAGFIWRLTTPLQNVESRAMYQASSAST